ncbi:hypothetical protein Lpp120_2125 [Lacticaseibacillus paracasei subsp. paracasei Lpp120]|nr:hypothetical protein Lpp120_2125 [Lacticaseibacillus paracasei subsp. paracasei Lpp120]
MTFSFSDYSDAVFLLLGCYNNGKRFRDLSKILCFEKNDGTESG